MGQAEDSAGSRVMGRTRPVMAPVASLLLLVALIVMNACASSSADQNRSPALHGAPDQFGPKSTNSTLLFPRHYDRQRLQTDSEYVDTLVGKMSLDEEFGQLFIAEYIGTHFDANNAAMITQMHAGGIILYSASVHDAKQTQDLIATSQYHSQIPLFVTVDEEGGCVDRLTAIYGRRPGAPDIGATGSTSFAYAQGKKAAQDMTALGFNVNMAPDVDVKLVEGRDLLCRTFGTTPSYVTKMAGAYLDGLQSNGVVGMLKHFPGLGDALDDAHLSLPVINRTRPQIESVELAPYRQMINAGQVQMVMTTDLLMPNIDPVLPAELSPAIITGILRSELGFNGVVMTDALYMQGISKTYSMPRAGVMAIQAGCDMLLGPWNAAQMRDMINALKAALRNGSLTKTRIDQSVKRILNLKISMGLISPPSPKSPLAAPRTAGSRVSVSLVAEIPRR